MTKAEAVQIAATIVESPYLELWQQAFRVLDPEKTIAETLAAMKELEDGGGESFESFADLIAKLNAGPADFEEAGGEN